jgi:hypothetical protein
MTLLYKDKDAYHIVNEGRGIYIEFMNEHISTNLKSMIL